MPRLYPSPRTSISTIDLFSLLASFLFRLLPIPEGRDNLTELCEAYKQGGKKARGLGGKKRTLSRAYSREEVGWEIKEEIVHRGEGLVEKYQGLGSF